MGSRPRHPSKDVEHAIKYAESKGWRVEKRTGHAWCRLFCPQADRSGCMISVYGTPRNPVNHASQIERGVAKCPHSGVSGGGEGTCDA